MQKIHTAAMNAQKTAIKRDIQMQVSKIRGGGRLHTSPCLLQEHVRFPYKCLQRAVQKTVRRFLPEWTGAGPSA